MNRSKDMARMIRHKAKKYNPSKVYPAFRENVHTMKGPRNYGILEVRGKKVTAMNKTLTRNKAETIFVGKVNHQPKTLAEIKKSPERIYIIKGIKYMH
jgi:hypothetical protein